MTSFETNVLVNPTARSSITKAELNFQDSVKPRLITYPAFFQTILTSRPNLCCFDVLHFALQSTRIRYRSIDTRRLQLNGKIRKHRYACRLRPHI